MYKGKKYFETCYTFTPFVSESYASFLEKGVEEEKRWYKTSVYLNPCLQQKMNLCSVKKRDDLKHNFAGNPVKIRSQNNQSGESRLVQRYHSGEPKRLPIQYGGKSMNTMKGSNSNGSVRQGGRISHNILVKKNETNNNERWRIP